MIELDARLTADGQLVVFHDRRLRRITGERGRVRDHTLSGLCQRDAGRWFSPRCSGERIPSLAEALASIPPPTLINIEIKTDPDRPRLIHPERVLATLLSRHPAVPRVLVTSFDHRFLRRLHLLLPHVPVGALVMPVRDLGRSPSSFRRRCGASFLVCSIRALRARMVRAAHRDGMSIACYTVNTRRQWHRAIRFGADIVITNHPAMMLRLRDSRR